MLMSKDITARLEECKMLVKLAMIGETKASFDLYERVDEAVSEIGRLRAQLEWYGEKAKSLAARDWKKGGDYAVAILTELSLDAGRRAGL